MAARATPRLPCGGASIPHVVIEGALDLEAWARDFEPISDMRASASYRLRAAQNLLRRFYHESRGDLETTVYAYGR